MDTGVEAGREREDVVVDLVVVAEDHARAQRDGEDVRQEFLVALDDDLLRGVLGEPALKMLRYQQQYSFFDESMVGKAIRFINLADVVLEKDLNAVLEEITRQVTALRPQASGD